jgi:outer membrane protein W
MRKIQVSIALLFLISNFALSQTLPELNLSKDSDSNKTSSFRQKKEYDNNWSINVVFSDNGFGAGATIFKQFSPDVSSFAGIFFSGAKDDREFDVIDFFGNTYTPYKVNRMFMIPLNIGLQFRLFREDVTDDLRPMINFGAAPTAIIYTPYDESFFSSFGKARAKYTVGAFAGIGLDYLTTKKSSLSLNVRYYYTQLFGQGIESLESKEKKYFGGLYFVFSYNFMK